MRKTALLLLFCLLTYQGDARSESLPWEALPFGIGQIYPTPQQVEYGKALPIRSLAIVPGKGLDATSPPLVALRQRAEQNRVRTTLLSGPAKETKETFDGIILLGEHGEEDPLFAGIATPEKPEGYSIRFAQRDNTTYVRLKGRDPKGEMWAVSSFNQLMRKEADGVSLTSATVDDYPAYGDRGVILTNATFYRNPKLTPAFAARFLTRFKMNWFYASGSLLPSRSKEKWRLPPDDEYRATIQPVADWLTPLGIRWTLGFRPVVGDPIVTSDPESVEHFRSYARVIYRAGGEMALHFDDHRFPLPEKDMALHGSAREADIAFLNAINETIISEFGADRRLIFCPPFYWGPRGTVAYKEDREAYLSALGKRTAPNLGIFWTGARVKLSPVTREDVQWITNLLGRKPILWANIIGPHGHWFYPGDKIDTLQKPGYDGLLEDVDGYLWNAHDLIASLTLLDYLWNPGAYDPVASPRIATQMLVGPDAYPHLLAAGKALASLDLYALRVGPGAKRDLPFIEESIAEAKKAYQQAVALEPQAVPAFSGTHLALARYDKYIERLKNASVFTKEEEEAFAQTRQHATAEVGYRQEGDLLLTASDFLGGYAVKIYGMGCEPRLATWIYGSGGSNASLSSSFECDPFPPEGDYELRLSAQDGGVKGKPCRIRISLNGQTLFEGPTPFVPGSWKQASLRLPADKLVRNNRLVIENIEPSALIGPPFFMLNYVVVGKSTGSALQPLEHDAGFNQ